MVHQIKVARDTAVKARSAAIITLKTLIVNAPDALRETLEPLTDRQLIDRCCTLRPGDVINPTASMKQRERWGEYARHPDPDADWQHGHGPRRQRQQAPAYGER